MALKFNWHKEQLMNPEDAKHAFALLRQQRPKYCGFDTETTGLNIKHDKPFFFQFGWLNTEPNPENQIDELHAYSFAVDLEKHPTFARRVIRSWHNWLIENKDYVIYIGQNVKYDMHMMANIEMPIPDEIYITELQFWIRYAHDALQPGEGGPPLNLKEYATRFLDRHAKEQDNMLQKERSEIAARFNAQLKNMLVKAACKVPEELKNKYKSMTLSCLQELFKDPVFDLDMLPEDIQKVYLNWKDTLPVWIKKRVIDLVDPELIPYDKLNRVILSRYACDDIIWTLETFWQCKPIAEKRNNTKAIYEIEEPALRPIWRMERTGFKVDRKYLDTCQINLRNYIFTRRSALQELTQAQFKIGQHAFIKDMLENDFDLKLDSTAANEVDLILSQLERDGTNPRAVQCIKLIQELRTLEKWYSVYIMRFKVELDFYDTDRIWTQFNSVGTVSGRFTSSMQQMPRDGISYDPINGGLVDSKKCKDAIELFNPRRMVIVPKDEGFAGMAIIDFANEEMRFQAMYTILCEHPDLNMCRAFMPYLCHRKDGTKYDYNKMQHLKEWNTGDWYYDENPEQLWQPTDLHSEMTINCGFDKASPDFKFYRNAVGKRLNFAKSYGCGLQKIMAMYPDFSIDKCKQLNDAYYQTFPGLKTFHQYCDHICSTMEYAENLFHVKYYSISSHKCKNMLIQGSAALFLKIKLKQIDDYIQNNKLRSVMIASVHDEVDFYIWPGEEYHIEAIQTIMEDWEDALIPIVADPDYGTETWADTKDKSYYKWKEKQNEI